SENESVFYGAAVARGGFVAPLPVLRICLNVAYPSGPATFAAIAELVLILQDQLDTAWTLEAMAARAGFAPHHLAHAFREHVGAPPLAYLRRLRLERAAYQLVSSDLALDDI